MQTKSTHLQSLDWKPANVTPLVWSGEIWVAKKYDVANNAECPSWDQASLNNIKLKFFIITFVYPMGGLWSFI